MIDARKHEAFGPLEEPSRARFNALSLSIRDVVPVANAVEATQVAAELQAAGRPISPAYPLYVHRADAHPASPLEFSVDGTTWQRVAPIVDHGIEKPTGRTLAPLVVATSGVKLAVPMPTVDYAVGVTLRSNPGGTGGLTARVTLITVGGFSIAIANTSSVTQAWDTGDLVVGWSVIHK